MQNKKIGSQTVELSSRPVIIAAACVGGRQESKGPLAACFDYLSEDTYFGEKTWEDAESTMLKKCFDLSLKKALISAESLDYIFSGDLLNQCIASVFALKDSNAPFFGIYGACSTIAEALSLAAMSIDGGYANTACALTSSHFCTAERQFRLPLNYGGLREPTAQWTATAAGSLILSCEGDGPVISHVTTGKMVDSGITNANNMGAAMAPAALETLCTHFADTGRTPDYYDFIVTGDLGEIGTSVLRELSAENGYDLSTNHTDCGLLIYSRGNKDIKAGASGCGCSASVLAGHFLPKLRNGEIKRILFAATGALTSSMTTQQGKNILGICHALSIENVGGQS